MNMNKDFNIFMICTFIFITILVVVTGRIGNYYGYQDGYNLGQKESNAYKIELDRTTEMYSELLATCRGNQ